MRAYRYCMRRLYVISDKFYRLSHSLKRNRSAVVIYSLTALLFLVIGIAIGVTVADKTEYALRNGAPIFRYLRGDSGAFAFFLLTFFFSLLYGAFAASTFYFKATAFLSAAPYLYSSYALGMYSSVILGIYSASALPMLFVLYIPMSIVEIVVYCMLSYKCFAFAALNGRCAPTWSDIKQYYKELLPFYITLAISALVKAVTLALFGSALVGII